MNIQRKKCGKISYKLPKLDKNQYELLMDSLQYYCNYTTEFSANGDVYLLINKIQKQTRITFK